MGMPTKQDAFTPTNQSGTTSATPSTATNAIASNSSRRGYSIQNLSDSATIWVNDLATAAVNTGHKILPNGYYETPFGMAPKIAVSVLSTTAAVPYTAREW
jgi:hypothetical protein